MPCNCDGFETPRESTPRKTAMLSAMVCALMRAISKHVCQTNGWPESDVWGWIIEHVDFEEAGVSHQEFAQWWLDHAAADKERLRQEGLAKLTAAERAALGLK